MKHYFFMNKPDVLESDEDGNPKHPVQFYYNRNERRSYLDNSEQTKLTLDIQHTVQKKKRKRRFYYILDCLLLLVLAFFVWTYYFNVPSELTSVNSSSDSKTNLKDSLLSNNLWLYTLKKVKSNSENLKWQLYLTNRSSEKRFLDKTYRIIFSVRIDNQMKTTPATVVHVQQNFTASQSVILASLQLKDKVNQSMIQSVQAQLDGKTLMLVD